MADEKKATGGADSAPDPKAEGLGWVQDMMNLLKGGGKLTDAVKKQAIRLFNKNKKKWARQVALNVLTPELRKQLLDNKDKIDVAVSIIATLTPEHGWWEFGDDVLQDFTREVIDACEHSGDKASAGAADEKDEKESQKETDLDLRVTQLALPAAEQDAFLFWYDHLSDEMREKFFALIDGMKDADLTAFMRAGSAKIEERIAAWEKRNPQEKRKLTSRKLQAAVVKDPALNADVEDLIRGTKILWSDFFLALEHQGINTIAELRDLLAVGKTDKKRVYNQLHLDPDAVPLSERAKNWTPKALGERIDKATGAKDAAGVANPSWQGPEWLVKLNQQAEARRKAAEAELTAKRGGRP